MSTPTLINLPPPPSDPVTPSEMGPGTPNSTITSMSELSTVAIKDGHRGHPHHHQIHDLRAPNQSSNSTLDAERADRISRLAGLERMTAVRQSSNTSLPPGASASNPQGYFDAAIPPNFARERSTVGSASATGSVGRTTWASGSDQYDATDKMSEDLETSSTGGFSDEGNASLVGFGEGASSTVSGPISTAPGNGNPNRYSGGVGSPFQAKVSAVPPYLRETMPQPMSGVMSPSSATLSSSGTAGTRDAKNIDEMTYDHDVVDTANSQPRHVSDERY